MKSHHIIFALSLMVLPATPAWSAPGDNVARSCIKAFDDLAKRGRPDKFHAVRHKVCNCVQQRVKDDLKIDNANKDKVGEVLAHMASDPVRSGELRRKLPKVVNEQMRKHMGACNK